MPMLYFAESNWKPIDDNPFSKDKGYGKLWSAFIYDETLSNSYTNFYPDAKVYTLSVNPLIDRHFERLIDFINYETKYGRNIILKVPSSTKSVIGNMINAKSIQDNKLIRLNDERWLVHSTTKQAWSEIRETGSLLSPTCLLKNGKTINEIGLKALLEPSDYSDYVMLDVLNGCSEIVVNSRQLGYICFDPNINYVPGIRLYFDAHKIIRDGLATRDGLHVLKVFEKLPLDKYLVMAIDEAILPQQSWTPTKFTQIANEHFLKIMTERKIENYIDEVLTGETQKNALEFASYLRANEMLFVRGKGYWEDKLYWMIKYKDEYVCFILINGSGSEEEFAPWIIWSDDSDSNWFADFPLDEHMKEIAWKNVDICGNCGGCGKPGGSRKTIFGKEFNNVCRTTLRFINPDVEALECIEKMVEIRKNDILRNI